MRAKEKGVEIRREEREREEGREVGRGNKRDGGKEGEGRKEEGRWIEGARDRGGEGGREGEKNPTPTTDANRCTLLSLWMWNGISMCSIPGDRRSVSTWATGVCTAKNISSNHGRIGNVSKFGVIPVRICGSTRVQMLWECRWFVCLPVSGWFCVSASISRCRCLCLRVFCWLCLGLFTSPSLHVWCWPFYPLRMLIVLFVLYFLLLCCPASFSTCPTFTFLLPGLHNHLLHSMHTSVITLSLERVLVRFVRLYARVCAMFVCRCLWALEY